MGFRETMRRWLKRENQRETERQKDGDETEINERGKRSVCASTIEIEIEYYEECVGETKTTSSERDGDNS